jgi:hypothetical protein
VFDRSRRDWNFRSRVCSAKRLVADASGKLAGIPPASTAFNEQHTAGSNRYDADDRESSGFCRPWSGQPGTSSNSFARSERDARSSIDIGRQCSEPSLERRPVGWQCAISIDATDVADGTISA